MISLLVFLLVVLIASIIICFLIRNGGQTEEMVEITSEQLEELKSFREMFPVLLSLLNTENKDEALEGSLIAIVRHDRQFYK